MKKIIPILMLSFLAAGCYEEILIPTEDKDPVLVMNSQMNNLEEVHVVHLSRSLLSRVEPFPGATVKVYVNDAFVAQAVEMDDENAWNSTPYAFEAVFHPGDEVRVEAVKDAFRATATAHVPQPVYVESVDTSSVRMVYMDSSTDYVQLKVRFKDIPGDTWYGVDHRYLDVWEYLDEEGNPSPEFTVESIQQSALDTGFDPVISEGAGKTAGSDLTALLAAENYYHCFADTPIADQECTLRVMVYEWNYYLDNFRYALVVPDWMEDDPDAWSVLLAMPVRIHRTCCFRLRSLDFSQYHYLKALNNMENYGTEVNFLVEPTTLPSNVEGGLGFVGIETVTELPYAELEQVYDPADIFYY